MESVNLNLGGLICVPYLMVDEEDGVGGFCCVGDGSDGEGSWIPIARYWCPRGTEAFVLMIDLYFYPCVHFFV